MDRKIELETLPQKNYEELLLAVNTEILQMAKECQNSINLLLKRFNVECSLSLAYSVCKDALPETSKSNNAAPSESNAKNKEKSVTRKKRSPKQKNS